MKKEDIIEAFRFYDIESIEYQEKCINALYLINEDINLKTKVLELIDTLYIKHEDYKFVDIINTTYDDLFNIDNLYITNVIILLGYKVHQANIRKFDNKTIETHKKRLKEGLLLGIDGMSVRQMIWLSHFIKGIIIEVGCLQYQIMDNETYGCTIKIHIPKKVNFNIDNIKDSIKESKYYIKKYYNINNPKYFCNSWMLSTSTKECLNENANIYKFASLFDIKEEYESLDILRFIFKTVTNDYENLICNTSLQKNIKYKLLNKEKLYNAIGVLKNK